MAVKSFLEAKRGVNGWIFRVSKFDNLLFFDYLFMIVEGIF